MLTDKHLDVFVKAPPDTQAKALSLLDDATRQAILARLSERGNRD